MLLPEVPDLDDGGVIILGGQTELSSNLGVPGHNLGGRNELEHFYYGLSINQTNQSRNLQLPEISNMSFVSSVAGPHQHDADPDPAKNYL